jgi:hypothetical protein
MGSHPVNLGVRFLLEICALVSAGYWGWVRHRGVLRYVAVIGVPLILVLLWSIFAVPDDPSRSGRAPVPVPGVLRLALELAIFAFASWALHHAGYTAWGLALAGVVVVHYAVSYDRVLWLLKQ